VRLEIKRTDKPIFSQVDCQHRLGHLSELNIELPFMSFVGLSDRDEMEIFNVINSKAKGLNSSLLDFHEASLSADLAADRPEIFIAIFLRNEAASPWFGQLSLGGHSSSGMARKASLRTLQKAVHYFLRRTKILDHTTVPAAAQVVLNFWAAVPIALSEQWSKPRTHVLTKGVGVYCLMEIAADLYQEAVGRTCDKAYFISALSDFTGDFDWSTNGPLKGLGGEGGAAEALRIVREARKTAHLKLVSNG
jgi:DGQHR domain-containing protein